MQQNIDSGQTQEDEAAILLSRRRFLRLAALLGGGAAAVAALEACGSSKPKPNSAKKASSMTGSPHAAAAAVSPTPGSIKLAADQTLRYPYVEPVTMDPGLANTDVQIMMNLWEGLISFDDENNAVPLGATNWDISPDGVTYTFHLRDGIKWTDGTPVTAHDYEWTWKRNEDPKTASVYANALYSIKGAQAYNKGQASADAMGVKAVDDKTLQVTLEGPAGYFLRIASTWTALPLPRQSVEKYGAKWTEPGNIISNGPFKLDTWQHDQQMVLLRNEEYWGSKPTLDKIVVPLSSDVAKSSLPAFENHELDFAFGPWPADMDRLNGDPTLSKQLHIFPNSQTVFLVCDTTNSNSPVSKLPFRQALYLAVDREQIVNNVFKKVGVPAYTMLPPDILGYNPGARISGGVKEAKQALASAGYPDGKGVPALTLTYIQTSANDLLVQVLQQMWQNTLGIKVDLNAMESKAFYNYRASLKNNRFDMMLNSWGSDYLDPFDWDNFLFTSGTDYYHSHWSNADFDNLVNQAANLTDQTKRKALYQQAEALHVKEAPEISLYYTATAALIEPWVAGYVHQAVGGDKWASIKIAQH